MSFQLFGSLSGRLMAARGTCRKQGVLNLQHSGPRPQSFVRIDASFLSLQIPN